MIVMATLLLDISIHQVKDLTRQHEGARAGLAEQARTAALVVR
jgi:hypothetical protein